MEDRSDDYALIAVQGPRAARLLARVTTPGPERPSLLRIPRVPPLRARRRSFRAPATRAKTASRSTCRPELGGSGLPRSARRGPRGRDRAVRPRRAGHPAAGSEDGALRKRHRRHRDALGSGPRLDREDEEGGFHRPRGARAAEERRGRPQARGLRDGRSRNRAPRLCRGDAGRAGPGHLGDAFADAQQADRPRDASGRRHGRRDGVRRRHPRPGRAGPRRGDALLQTGQG